MRAIGKILIYSFTAPLLLFLASMSFSQNHIIDMSEQLASATSFQKKIELYIEISEEYRQINSDSAFRYSEKAFALANESKNQKLIADASVTKATITAFRGNYSEGLILASQALEYYFENNDEKGKLKAYSSLGLIYSFSTDYTRSVDNQFKALKIAEKTGNAEKQAMLQNNIAYVYMMQGDFDNALELLDRTLSIKGSGKVEVIKAMANVNKGIIYAYRKDYNSAEKYYKKALEQGLLFKNLNVVQSAFTNMAHLESFTGNNEKAEEYYRKAIALQLELKMYKSYCSSIKGMGDVFRRKKQFDKALRFYKTADSIALIYKYPEIRAEIFLYSSEIYADQKKLEMAYNSMAQYAELKDSLNRTSNKKQIAQIEANYELEQKDNQIKVLNLQKENNEQRISQQFILILILSIGALVFLVILILLVLQRRKKEFAYRELVRKNLEMMKLEKHEERNHAKTVVSPVLSDIPAAVEAIAQSEETENRQEESGVLKKYEKSNLSDEQKERLLSAILTLMENEKPYLDPDLTLDVVSQKLNVYKKYISQVINEKLGKNFITFINEYRVRDSKKMLIDKKFHNYTIEGIANTSGFHSKTSFNTAFKKFTGITPSFFREEALKSNNTLREK